MPTYIALAGWTRKGIGDIKVSPDRLDKAKKAFAAAGAELKQFYMVMGQYDMVVIADAPNDESMAKAILQIASGGAVRTETFRAFTEDEYRKIIADLP